MVAGFIALVKAEGRVVEAGESPSIGIRDATDIPILACAIGGGADVFVTGDKELLDLRRIGTLPILSPRELWLQLMGVAEPKKPK